MDIFSKIAAGEIPSYKCAESEKFYAFLDINPVVQAHTLVIPRREVDYIFDMEDDELAEFEVFAKRVAKAIRTAFPCKKVAQVVLGLEVPHAHPSSAHQLRGRCRFPSPRPVERGGDEGYCREDSGSLQRTVILSRSFSQTGLQVA